MKFKKGFISSGFATVLLYFGFVLLIILFYFVLRLTVGETKVPITGHIGDADTNFEVISYLRTPVTIKLDNKEVNMDITDIIVRYYLSQGTENEGKFQSFISEKSKEIFNEKYPHLRWKLKVSDKILNFPKNVASGQTTSQLTNENTLVKGISVACLLLPNPELKKPIKVEFDLLNLNADAFERAKYDGLKSSEFNC